MPALPRLLAGPIVRRVDATGCSIWIATSEAASAQVTLWQNSQMAGSSPGTVSGGSAVVATSESVDLSPFGENLFIGVITVPLGRDGRPPLNPGSIYSYDITLTGDFGTSGLRQEGLLQDETSPRLGGDTSAPRQLALGYVENRLPSFVAPAATVDNLRLAHASCRKTNDSSPDALAWLDDEIEKNFDLTDKRVQQLFLTGDQIYADDLAACLLPMLNQLAQDLIGSGRQEQLPIGDTNHAGTLANFPALRRAKLVRGTGGFSSTAADNHLLTFGEFAAMYLLVWSPRVWRALSNPADLFITPPSNPALQEVLTDFEACFGTPNPIEKWKTAREGAVTTEKGYVEAFRDTVPKVARALANVVTYMIFDDHEVTDDWNLNQRWRNRVLSKDLGRAVIRNGLMAYGLFQGWGNEPAEFAKVDDEGESSNNKKFLEEVQKVLGTNPASTSPIPVGSTDQLDELLGLTNAKDTKRVKWYYQVLGPRHRVCVLDTRTNRKFKGQGIAPPDLLGDTLNKQVPEGPANDGRELMVIVSAAPVLGPQLIEALAAPLYGLISDFSYGYKQAQERAEDPCHPHSPEVGAETADAESWSADEVAREKFLERVAPHKKVVILSGDVHYGLTLRMDYWKGNDSDSTPIVQLTSSPSRNQFQPVVEAVVRYNARLQQYQEGVPPELLGWKASKPFEVPDGVSVSPGRFARLRRSPSLLPARGWPSGVSLADDKPPDWRWRIQLISDVRPESELPIDAPRLPALDGGDLDPGGTAAQHIDRYIAIATRHQLAALANSFLLLRRIVFTSNIGLASLGRNGDDLVVQHTLLSRSTTPPYTGVANTYHVTPLEPTTEAVPALQTEA